MSEFKYSIEIYDDRAIIRGRLNLKILNSIFRLCRKEGFTHVAEVDHNEGISRFRLVKIK